jgi:hypothetical protein
LPLFIEAKHIYINILAIGFFALIAVSLATKYAIIIRYVLLILAIPSCCVFSYLSIDVPERILKSIYFNNHRYHITVKGNFDETYVTFMIYKCDVDDFKCQELYSEYRGGIDSVDFVIDNKIDELHAVFNGRMKYTDGFQPHQILASEEYEGFLYNVAIPPADVYYIYGSSSREYTYMLYKCKISFTECQKLPFHYTDSGGTFRLILNESTNELEMYNWKSDTGSVLIYSQGIEPKCYVERCSIPNE